MRQNHLSLKQHTIIAFSLCAWTLLFTLLMKPFEHGDMNTRVWVMVAITFSLSAFVSYMSIAFFQLRVLAKFITWNYRLEILAIVLFFALYSVLTYISYKSPWIMGYYTAGEFLSKIMLKVAIIFMPILIVSRQFARRQFATNVDVGNNEKADTEVIIRGENKLDVLKLKQSQIISASNAQNYVEISYLDGGKLCKKLIRASLKNILNEHEFLSQIHRSHLINPEHFISWKDSSNILLTQMELPVSKNYKKNLPTL